MMIIIIIIIKHSHSLMEESNSDSREVAGGPYARNQYPNLSKSIDPL